MLRRDLDDRRKVNATIPSEGTFPGVSESFGIYRGYSSIPDIEVLPKPRKCH